MPLAHREDRKTVARLMGTTTGVIGNYFDQARTTLGCETSQEFWRLFWKHHAPWYGGSSGAGDDL